MKTNTLKTTVNNKYIFKSKKLSYHTKCILSKIITDWVTKKEPLDFIYLEDNIFGTWPKQVVITALNELAENEIMFIDMDDEDSEEECETEALMFNPEFVEKACPYMGYCPYCNPAPLNFNILYN